MEEQKEKKSNNNKVVGYLMIVLGIVGIVSRFIGEPNWTNFNILKLVFSILVLAYGVWTVVKKPKE